MYSLDVEYYEHITLIRFAGDMTLLHAVELRDELEHLLKNTKVKDIVLDLGLTRTVDSSGLGALVGVSTSARSWGKRLMLYNSTPEIIHTLEQVEISGFFPTLDSEHDLKSRLGNRL